MLTQCWSSLVHNTQIKDMTYKTWEECIGSHGQSLDLVQFYWTLVLPVDRLDLKRHISPGHSRLFLLWVVPPPCIKRAHLPGWPNEEIYLACKYVLQGIHWSREAVVHCPKIRLGCATIFADCGRAIAYRLKEEDKSLPRPCSTWFHILWHTAQQGEDGNPAALEGWLAWRSFPWRCFEAGYHTEIGLTQPASPKCLCCIRHKSKTAVQISHKAACLNCEGGSGTFTRFSGLRHGGDIFGFMVIEGWGVDNLQCVHFDVCHEGL